MSIIGTIYEDITTDILGKIGPWQWRVTIFCTAMMVPVIFSYYEDILLLEIPKGIRCLSMHEFDVVNSTLCQFYHIIDNDDIKQSNCTKWDVNLMWMVWIKKTWLVFCDKGIRRFSVPIIYRAGLMFGSIMCGLVADSFGRKKSLIASVVMDVIFSFILIYCDSEGWYRLLILLKAVCGSASLFMGLIIVCEIASNSWRSKLNFVVITPRLVALVCLQPFANSFPNWDTIILMSCIYSMLSMIALRKIPESPQWLLYNRKIPKAEDIIYRASKMNKVQLCSKFKIRPIDHRAYHVLDEPRTCLGVMVTHNIAMLVVTILLFWGIYYFMWGSFYIRTYKKSINYVTLKVVGCGFGFAIMSVGLYEVTHIKYVLIFNVIVTGLFGCAGILFGEEYPFLSGSLLCLALASGVNVHAIILNMTPRFFAVNIRATMLGSCHAIGQLGAIASTLVFIFHATDDITSVSIMTVLFIILASLCMTWPTLDERELPDVMEDMDYFSELTKPLRWSTQRTHSPSREEIEMRVYSFGSNGQDFSMFSQRRPPKKIGFSRLCQRIYNNLKNVCLKSK